MILLVFFSKNEKAAKEMEASLRKNIFLNFEFVFISDPAQTIGFLEYQIPQFAIFDLDDPDFSNPENFSRISADPWMSNVAFFGVTTDVSIEENINFPFFYIFIQKEIPSQMHRILSVLMVHENLLFRSGFIQDIGNKGIYEIRSDINEVKPYAELIANVLFNRGLVNTQKKYAIIFALHEMLMNAIEHGNCEINSEEKQAWLESNRDILELIQLKKQDREIAARTVILEYDMSNDSVVFTITDKGKGFNPESYLNLNVQKNTHYSGRGILMTKGLIDSVTYYPPGNKVSLTIGYDDTSGRKFPVGFQGKNTIELSPGDVLFNMGEKGDGLYYIVNGIFESWIDGKIVNILDSRDVFLGEMAFLLGQKRSATVKARTAATVVFIGTKEWIDTIRKYPFYGIYLSRILARKLSNLSVAISTLKQI